MKLAEVAAENGQPRDTLPAKRPHIRICTPCHSGKVDLNYHISLALACGHLLQHGINYSLDYNVGMAVDWARSQMATAFLKDPEQTHLLFIDDDMAFSADLPFRLLAECLDIVAVPYRRKQRDVKFNIRHGVRVKTMPGRPHLAAVESIATGMMMIRKNVFEKLVETTPEFLYTNDGTKGFLFFRHQLVQDEMVGGVSYMGEDYWFCRTAREAGFDVWAYVDEPIVHIGPYAFDGNYVDYMEKEVADNYRFKGERLPVRTIIK